MAGSGKELVPVKKAIGRPKGSGSLYSEEVADEIIERMIDGETLVRICKFDLNGGLRERGTFPNHATVYDWGNPAEKSCVEAFVPRFSRAKLAQHRGWIESTVDVARTAEPSYEEMVEHSARNGVTIRRTQRDGVTRSALIIETLYKAAARLDPQHWAERLQQVSSSQPTEQNELVIRNGLPDED